MRIEITDAETEETPGSVMEILARYGVKYKVDLKESGGTKNPFPIPYDFQPKRIIEFSLDNLWAVGNTDAIVEVLELVQWGQEWEIVRVDPFAEE